MKNHVVRPRGVKVARNRSVRPALEGLEDRILQYATTGNQFAFGSRITWSFEPDGTNLGGVSSNLAATLDARIGPGRWQQAIFAAFATWENYANVNLPQVNDDGSATNSGPYQQGATNIGDIRIGGFAQPTSTLAFTLLPPKSNGGSDAGDIFLNTAQPWNLNSDYDLETVLIHEIGHALGLGHSADAGAAMYSYYQGVRQSVDQDDVNGIQAVWGPRAEDSIALATANFTSARAADITKYTNYSNNWLILPNMDVASSSESYWFKFTTPGNASTNLTARIQSSGLSELSPKIQLYNASLQGIAQNAAAAGGNGSVVGVSIANATPNTTYYLHVSGSNVGVTGTGAYALQINMGSSPLTLSAPPNTQVAAQPDQGGGSSYDWTGGKPHHGHGHPGDQPDIIQLGKIEAAGDFLQVAPAKQVAAKHVGVAHPTGHVLGRRPHHGHDHRSHG